jgi:hypothetical protein
MPCRSAAFLRDAIAANVERAQKQVIRRRSARASSSSLEGA